MVVLDVRRPDINGLEMCRTLKAQDSTLQMIMFTSFGGQDLIVDAINAGATGYLLKESYGRAVIDGIRTGAQGGALFGPECQAGLMGESLRPRFEQPWLIAMTALLWVFCFALTKNVPLNFASNRRRQLIDILNFSRIFIRPETSAHEFLECDR